MQEPVESENEPYDDDKNLGVYCGYCGDKIERLQFWSHDTQKCFCGVRCRQESEATEANRRG